MLRRVTAVTWATARRRAGVRWMVLGGMVTVMAHAAVRSMRKGRPLTSPRGGLGDGPVEATAGRFPTAASLDRRSPRALRLRSSPLNVTVKSAADYRLVHRWIGPELPIAEPSEWDISMVTHTTVDHLDDLVHGASAWRGPVSVAVLVRTASDLDAVVTAIPVLAGCPAVAHRVTVHLAIAAAASKDPGLRLRIATVPTTWSEVEAASVHFDGNISRSSAECGMTALMVAAAVGYGDGNYAKRAVYPNNLLRNLARGDATTPWALTVDVDMVVAPPTLFDDWRRLGRAGQLPQGRTIGYVLPAFEVRAPVAGAVVELPLSRPAICRAFNRTVRPFYWEPCTKCHMDTGYEEWLAGNAEAAPYHAAYHDPWEPFYISETRLTPAYDERFVQYGFNRVSQVCAMWMAGFDFVVVRHAFVLHIGWKTKERFHQRKQAEQDANRLVYRRLKEELKRRYPGPRRCNKHGHHV
mmetsp:Transcript_35784/g.93628  ORF Transcript_35784/g.93628 Transcript_35784/m.93628 type:complete len:467 (+) Transcript_35784:332-1732(+)